jgi:diguanylate cyclase (GGDEF)-like protein
VLQAAEVSYQPQNTSSQSDKDLRSENQQLRRQLRAFIAHARQNEQKLQYFQRLELRLINSRSLLELFHILLYDYKQTSQLDFVNLSLLDTSYEIRQIIEEDGTPLSALPDVRFLEYTQDLHTVFDSDLSPYVGKYVATRFSKLFAHEDEEPGSIVVLPLIRDNELIGSLNIGSKSLERFIAGSAIDFMQRLGEITAICVKNVINAERLRRMGLTDVLTGVNNRRFFDQRLFEEVAAALRNQTPMCALFFDVDHFKKVNDHYGHQAGDIVLKEIASMIRMNLRASDVIARYGGEEFAALLSHTDLKVATEIAERIRHSIETRAFPLSTSEELHCTISIGIALLSPFEQDADGDTELLGRKLVELADQCLYSAKKNGRNQVRSDVLHDNRQHELPLSFI